MTLPDKRLSAIERSGFASVGPIFWIGTLVSFKYSPSTGGSQWALRLNRASNKFTIVYGALSIPM